MGQSRGLSGRESIADLDAAPPTLRFPSSPQVEAESQQDAFRIQVAAVAAQQAALFEEESKLQNQQQGLTRQQEQLAAHLEEKHRRALETASQLQIAHAELQRQRDEQIRDLAMQREALAKDQTTLAKDRRHLLVERRRVSSLERKLKQHMLRRLAGEREQLRKRETAVTEQHRRIEREAEKLQVDRDALARSHLSFNGDIELAKRQLQVQRDQLVVEQKQAQERRDRLQSEMAEQTQALRQRQNALAEAEQAFTQKNKTREQKARIAEQEAQGLENRIVNLRRKLASLEKAVDGGVACFRRNSEPALRNAAPEGGESMAPNLIHVPPSTIHHPPSTVHQSQVAELEQFADDLADQRLLIVEQWQHLAQARGEWEQVQVEAVRQLEEIADGLPAKELALEVKKVTLEATEAELKKREREVEQFRQHLAGWAARVRARETAWESQQSRLLAELRGNEAAAEKQLAAVVVLRKKWALRRRQEIAALKAEHAACEKLRQECAELREDYLKRGLSLAQQERELADRALAMEEFRRRIVMRATDAATTESRLDRIQKRFQRENAGVMQTIKDQFERLQTEAALHDQRGQGLLKAAQELIGREARLAELQASWEEKLTSAEIGNANLLQQLQTAHGQHERSQQQIAELQSEIDRLARIMLDAVEDHGRFQAAAA